MQICLRETECGGPHGRGTDVAAHFASAKFAAHAAEKVSTAASVLDLSAFFTTLRGSSLLDCQGKRTTSCMLYKTFPFIRLCFQRRRPWMGLAILDGCVDDLHPLELVRDSQAGPWLTMQRCVHRCSPRPGGSSTGHSGD
eukprot:2905094-Pyramimonas_sp.AAC.1